MTTGNESVASPNIVSGPPLPAFQAERRTGAEPFTSEGQSLPFRVLDFWQWAASDLLSNALRGRLAEFLVACDLGVANGIRNEWDAYDLATVFGQRVEVKSAAYHQTWAQQRESAIAFGIAPTTGWDAATGASDTLTKRQADVYVFALLHHRDRQTIDPLNVDQWTFYVLPTSILNERMPNQKSLRLATLLALSPVIAKFGELQQAIDSLFAPAMDHPERGSTPPPAP
jgi:hypothetical protein